jgi:pimeloyl-ACP methyl ester carboxylesterase
VHIHSETFGRPGDPPVLLIMGQMASMLWWPDGFCERLASVGRFVIRYDNRDTGLSAGYEPGAATYTLNYMAGDALRVLDEHGIERAHVAGFSLGGAIAQLLSLEHPERVATLTLMSTTKIGSEDTGLPGPSEEYMRHAAAWDELDWSDTGAVADMLVRDARAIAGTRHPFDEAAARDLVERDLTRATDPRRLANHGEIGGDESAGSRLGELAAPLLVIHGTADPLLPYPHGEALAAAVPGAELVTVEGGGHELHERDWDQILAALVRHTAAR